MQNFLVSHNVNLPKARSFLKVLNHFSLVENLGLTCRISTRRSLNLIRTKRRRKTLQHAQERRTQAKWTFLEHRGPVFPKPYEPLPESVKFYYDGNQLRLSQSAEEVASYYARMLDHDYITKEMFNINFLHDWRNVMCEEERVVITNLEKCNFQEIYDYLKKQSELNRHRTKEEKLKAKETTEELRQLFGQCRIDDRLEQILNYKIEPPGLYRGRGDHPKMGMLKKRIQPEDVIINCSKDSVFPKPPEGHTWKEIRHDNSVIWLACWSDAIENKKKYIMLNPSSMLRSENDFDKFDTASRLHKFISRIRKKYQKDWTHKDIRIRQRGVALYFIDRLALRVGTEKSQETVDTVGCCSLRVEHVTLLSRECAVLLDFLGKDSIRYYNKVPVEKVVFLNLKQFIKNKTGSDLLFDKLSTRHINMYLTRQMPKLTAKVFRTYNASYTLQKELKKTSSEASIAEKLMSYKRANRAVAILCNHQRTVPKCYHTSMEKLNNKIHEKRKALQQTSIDRKLEKLRDQLARLELERIEKEENKCVALQTSKVNYLDPRISVAWCKKYNVPIENIYTKTQREKFRWAIEHTGPDFQYGT